MKTLVRFVDMAISFGSLSTVCTPRMRTVLQGRCDYLLLSQQSHAKSGLPYMLCGDRMKKTAKSSTGRCWQTPSGKAPRRLSLPLSGERQIDLSMGQRAAATDLQVFCCKLTWSVDDPAASLLRTYSKVCMMCNSEFTQINRCGGSRLQGCTLIFLMTFQVPTR